MPDENLIKLIFSKKATEIDEIFTIINFCGLPKKHELFYTILQITIKLAINTLYNCCDLTKK